jgi:hypothetical protein
MYIWPKIEFIAPSIKGNQLIEPFQAQNSLYSMIDSRCGLELQKVIVRGLPIASLYPLYHPSLFPDLLSPLESFPEFPETLETSGTTPGLTGHIQALF